MRLLTDDWEIITRESRAVCRKNSIPVIDSLVHEHTAP